MALLKTNDQLTIVNRSTEYCVDKKVICKIPYFAKMLNSNLFESKENKVVLDFDGEALKAWLHWLEFSRIFIQMKFVINLFNMADYFGMEDNLMQDCAEYFHDRFSISNLPDVFPQVNPTSKLINSHSLGLSIRRHFLKIATSDVWLDYNVEIIEYICTLDLMIHSEYQVFNAIIRWINFKADSRKCHLERLLKLVRWYHLDDKDLSKIKANGLFKSSGLESKFSSKKHENVCISDRTRQNYFIEIHKLSGTSLRIVVLDLDFTPVIDRVFELDNQMNFDLLHDDHVSDVFFDSGRQEIRIDWKRNPYCLLDLAGCKSQYKKIHNFIQREICAANYARSNQIKETPLYQIIGCAFLEADEKFILISSKGGTFDCWSSVNAQLIEKEFHNYAKNFIATVLDNNIYLLSNKFDSNQFYLAFNQYNLDRQEAKSVNLSSSIKTLNFNNLILTSNQTYGDRVILIDKSSSDVFCFDINTQKWSSIGRFANFKSGSTDGQKDELLTFTSAFLAMDCIKLCSK